MKRFYFLYFCLIIHGNLSVAQSYSIQIKIANQPDNPVIIGRVRGDKFFAEDTLAVRPLSGSFSSHDLDMGNSRILKEDESVKVVTFNFDNSQPSPAMYRFIFGQTTYARVMGESPQQLDFIYNNEDIVMETDFKAPLDSLKVEKSEENQVWFDFLRKENELKEKMDDLETELNYYQSEAASLSAVKENDDTAMVNARAFERANEFNQLQMKRDQLITSIVNENEGMFAAKLIQTFREPFRDGFLTMQERKISYQKEYFRYLDLSDETLINSTVLTDKVFDFLVTFNQKGFTREQREEAYIEAVDIVLSTVRGGFGPGAKGLPGDSDNSGSSSGIAPDGSLVYEFILDYLVNGFEMLKMDNVLVYISENYEGPFCQNNEKSTLERKLGYMRMNTGTVVPDFTMEDINGKPVTLSKILKERNIIIFWASWCPHCCEMLHLIREWYDRTGDKNLEIIAVSIDTSLSEWYNAIKKSGFHKFINLSDFNKWDGPVTEAYNIYATPTMFVIDESRKIIAKPLTFAELTGSYGKWGEIDNASK